MKDHLIWEEKSRKTVFSCSIFSVGERLCCHDGKKSKKYSVIETSDWAIVIPVLETTRGKEFVMVWQWRHGAQELSLEFPGGVFEKGENAHEAAARELHEETGFRAQKMEKLGVYNPNPAIMSNRVHFFLAEELDLPSAQELDEDEYVEVETVPWKEVLNGMGKPPYIHALMGTAMALYLGQHKIKP
jgi:8-oxo-dGTP pyrophosphatase MutT (NUDIX family)